MKKLLPLFGILLTLGLAYGLQFLLTPKLFYPYNVLATGGVQTHMLHQAHRDASQCSRMLSTISTAVQSTCAECSMIKSACLTSLSKEQREWRGSTALQFPSLRSPGMITVYQSSDPNLALSSCHESERQIRRNNTDPRIICSPPGTLRPALGQTDRQPSGVMHPYDALLWANGAIFAGLSCLMMASFLMRRQVAGQGAVLGKWPSIAPLSVTGGWVRKLLLAGTDVLVMLFAFAISAAPDTAGGSGSLRSETNALYTHGALVCLAVLWFWIGLEHYSRRRTFFDELREIFQVVLGVAILAGVLFFITESDTPRMATVVTWGFGFLLIPLGRSTSRALLDSVGLWRLPAVIIGSGENANDAYQAICNEHSLGYDTLAFIAADPDGSTTESFDPGSGGKPIPVIPAGRDICTAVDSLGPVRIIIALDSLVTSGNQALVQTIALRYRNVHIIPALRGLPLFGTEVSHFFKHEVLFLTLRNNLARRSYQWIKRGFDLAGAIGLIVMLAPVFALLAWLIRRSGGTAIYGHMRIGRNGKPFKCLKFRSMRPDADKILAELLANDPQAKAEWDKDFKLRNDPRITPVGHFLRRTSLDELPQLFNVLKGEMSLVGPRPVVTQELERYGENVQYYLEVRPGMTGLWQVSGRNDTTYAQRVSLDSWYVQNWSLWYDVAILFKTIDIVFNRHGAY